MADQDFNHLPDLAKKIHSVLGQLVRKAAFDVEAAAKGYAAVESGFMRSAIYTLTSESNGYGQGLVGDGTLEAPMEPPSDDLTAYVVAGADYSIYVNNGTSRQVAQPFMEPAADQVRPSLEMAGSKLESFLQSGGNGS